jgi:hypothetical protein
MTALLWLPLALCAVLVLALAGLGVITLAVMLRVSREGR